MCILLPVNVYFMYQLIKINIVLGVPIYFWGNYLIEWASPCVHNLTKKSEIVVHRKIITVNDNVVWEIIIYYWGNYLVDWGKWDVYKILQRKR